MRKILSLLLCILFLAGSVPFDALAESFAEEVPAEAAEAPAVETAEEALPAEAADDGSSSAPIADEAHEEAEPDAAELSGAPVAPEGSETIEAPDEEIPCAAGPEAVSEDETVPDPESGIVPTQTESHEADEVIASAPACEEPDDAEPPAVTDEEDALSEVPGPAEAEDTEDAEDTAAELLPAAGTDTELMADAPDLHPVSLTHSGSGRILSDKESAAEGAAVKITLTPDLGFVLSSLSLNGNDVTEEVVSGQFVFIMPGSEAVLEAVFSQDASLTAYGACGKNVQWTLSTAGLLHLFGTGPMEDYAPADSDKASGSTAPFSAYRASILSVKAEEGITHIGSAALRSCSALSSVTLPESLVSIGGYAFAGCSALGSAELPAGLRTIGAYAFSDAGLTSLALPEELQSLGKHALEGCASLAEVRLPSADSFTRIEPYAFYGCGSLKRVTVPGNVLEIGDSAFYGCTLLEQADLPEYLESIGPRAFSFCPSLTSLTLPRGIKSIESGAFKGCTGLQEVRLPAALKEIREEAFAGCTALSMLYLPKSVTFIGENAFSASGLTALYFRGTKAGWDAVDKPGLPPEVQAVCLGDTPYYEASYILSPQQQIPFTTEPAELKDALTWVSETPSVCTLEDGVITAVGSGTGYISGVGEFPDSSVTARIRIDVTDGAEAADDIISVSLQNTAVTVEIYKTKYARISLLPNRAVLHLDTGAEDVPQNAGVLITDAQFSDKSVRARFSLRVVDDRTLEVIPTEYAIANAAKLKSSYTSAITLTFSNGTDMTTYGAVRLTVKKSKPAIKAKKLTLNSYSSEHTVSPVFSGGRVTAFEAASLPSWLTLDGNVLRIKNDAFLGGKYSGTVKLTCTVDGWVWQPTVSFTVKASPAAPSFKFSTSAVTLNPGTVDSVPVVYTVKNPTSEENDDSVAIGPIYEIAGKDLLPVENGAPIRVDLLPASHTFTLSSAATDGRAHKYRVCLSFGDRVAGYVTVKTVSTRTAAKLKLTQSGAVDTGIIQSPITLKAVPACFHGQGVGERYAVRILQSKKGTPTEDVTDLFSITETASGVFRITEQKIGSLRKKYTYTAVVTAYLNEDDIPDAENSIKLKIRHTPAGKALPSVKLKTSGSIDVLRPGTRISLSVKLKNCFTYTPSVDDLHFYVMRGKTPVPLENAPFYVTLENGIFILRENAEEGPVPGTTYAVRFESMLDERKTQSKLVKLSVKQGKVRLSSSSVSGTLLIGDRYDTVTLHIGSKDASLRGIRAVTMDTRLFTLTDIGEGDYSIGWQETTLSNPRIRPKSGSSKTLTLSVFYEGNPTAKPNAKLKVKLRFAVDYSISEKIVEYAYSYLGTPYSQCDCSKLTLRVCSRFDSHFMSGSHLQWRHTQASDLWSYVPYKGGPIPAGAIIFFSAQGNCHCGRPGEIHHVAISVGQGMMIDSTDRPDINCVNKRRFDDLLTYKGKPMIIKGYATFNE